MGALGSIVQAFVAAMVCVWSECFDRLNVAAELIRNDHSRISELINQSLQKTLGSLCVTVLLYEDVQNITVRVDGSPEP